MLAIRESITASELSKAVIHRRVLRKVTFSSQSSRGPWIWFHFFLAEDDFNYTDGLFTGNQQSPIFSSSFDFCKS